MSQTSPILTISDPNQTELLPARLKDGIVGISDSGVVAGNYIGSLDNSYGFVESQGNYTNIGDPYAATAGDTAVTGINSSGTVVGNYYGYSGEEGFIEYNGNYTTVQYSQSAGYTQETDILGIAQNGDLYGTFTDGTTGHQGYFLDSNGTFTVISDPNPQVESILNGINSSGTLLGTYVDTNYTEHFFTEANGTYTSISLPNIANLTEASVTGINDSGYIVGDYGVFSGGGYGFIENDGTYTTVQDPNAVYNGYNTATYITGINDNDVIVGYYNNSVYSDENVTQGFVDINGSFTTIDDPNSVYGTFLEGINDAGDIYGYYLNSDQDEVYFTTSLLCFSVGTRILTPNGEVEVEKLEIGDVVSLHDGAQATIKFIGTRSYDGKFIAGQHLALPVTFHKNSIAANVPASDLVVSPGHGMFIDGVIVPAWRLVNGKTITQAAAVERVDYFHIELAHGHGILLAENCPAESYLDIGTRNQFHNAAEFYSRYPEDAVSPGSCFPRIEGGFHLEAIQNHIAARAGIAIPDRRNGGLRGFVDRAGDDVGRGERVVSGWAQDTTQPEMPVILYVAVDDQPVMRILANQYRADLRAAGLGSGCHGFEVTLPLGMQGRVDVRQAVSGAILPLTEAAANMAGSLRPLRAVQAA